MPARLSFDDESSLFSADGLLDINTESPSQSSGALSKPEKELDQRIRIMEASGDLPESIEQRLDLLSRIAVQLGIEDMSFPRLSSDELSLARSVNRMEMVEEELRSDLAALKYELRLITTWTETLADENQAGNLESTANLQRRHAALTKKAKEYQSQLKHVLSKQQGEPPITVTELLALQRRLKEKRDELQAKRAKIKTFEGLPPNIDLARHELRSAREEQMKLFNLREKLLRHMASGVS